MYREGVGAESADSADPRNADLLSATAAVLEAAEHGALLVDHRWHVVSMSSDLRLLAGGLAAPVCMPLDRHAFGPDVVEAWLDYRRGPTTMDLQREWFRGVGGLVLTDTPGGRDELRELVHPGLRDVVDELIPADAEIGTFGLPSPIIAGPTRRYPWIWIRQRDQSGRLVGTALLHKPHVGMAIISAMISEGDRGHLERTIGVSRAHRRAAAVLMANLEGSSGLARKLSTASYFALARRLVRAADESIVDAGGIVGRHVGDGVTAFFLVEHLGSESAAARGCITAARALAESLPGVAERSGLEPDELVIRCGLHWGATLFVGNIATAGRTEVTALGDEVTETARIEGCATGGRSLASKALVERLTRSDADALGIDLGEVSYVALADLPTVTAKARRDAPNLSVCEVTRPLRNTPGH